MRFSTLLYGIIGVILAFFINWSHAQSLLQYLAVKSNNGAAVAEFMLTQTVKYKMFVLTKPYRMVVDFEDTRLNLNLNYINQYNIDHKLVTLVRSGFPKSNVLRLVFELKQPMQIKAYHWNSDTHAMHMLIINLTQNLKPQIVYQPHMLQVPTSTRPRPHKITIALDPGHGGKDPGAAGPKNILEKHITLNIAKKLKNIIDKQLGMRAVLTRKSDYYVPLRERLMIARKCNADVLISIHADAFIDSSSNGVSIFALSQRGATSEAARWLAAKENYSELGGVSLKNLDDKTGLVKSVLIDLSQTATISASLSMGDYVLKHLHTITKLHNKHVEQARFMVLKSPDIPSILIETGFVSNFKEAHNLNNHHYQDQLSAAILQGMQAYFREYPSLGSTLMTAHAAR